MSIDIKSCNLAIKLLTQYERLSEKYGVKLTPERMQVLDRKRDTGGITSTDLPATLQRNFPGDLRGRSLNEIREVCKSQF